MICPLLFSWPVLRSVDRSKKVEVKYVISGEFMPDLWKAVTFFLNTLNWVTLFAEMRLVSLFWYHMCIVNSILNTQKSSLKYFIQGVLVNQTRFLPEESLL